MASPRCVSSPRRPGGCRLAPRFGAAIKPGGRGCWRVWGRSDSFFFKPAETCGGGFQPPEVGECELTKSVSKLDPMHVDVVSRHVSEQAAGAVAGAVAKLGGGLLQMDFKVTIKADYTRMSSLLLSSLCTGYGLRSVEARMDLQNRIEREDETGAGEDLLSPKSRSGRHSKRQNPLLAYLAALRPESSLELAAASSPEVMHAFLSVVRQQMAVLGFTQPEPKGFWGRMESPDVEILQEDFMKAIEWCMLVGYYIHYEEFRLSLERCIDMPQSKPDNSGEQDRESTEHQEGFSKRFKGILRWLREEN